MFKADFIFPLLAFLVVSIGLFPIIHNGFVCFMLGVASRFVVKFFVNKVIK